MADEFTEMTPESISELSPDEARGHIDSVMRAAREDPKHAYIDGRNPGHKQSVENMRLLHERANPQPEPQTNADGKVLVNQYSPETVLAMKEGLEIQEGRDESKQAKLISEAEAEMVKLVELGFDDDSAAITDDIAPCDVRALKQQRLLTEAVEQQNSLSWGEFGLMLKKDFAELKNTPEAPNREALALLDRFVTVGDPSYELTAKIANVIMKHIYQLKKGEKNED